MLATETRVPILNEIIRGLPLSRYEGIDESTEAEITSFNETASATVTKLRGLTDRVQAVIADCESGSVLEEMEQTRFDRVALTQDLLKHWIKREQLCRKMVSQIEEHNEPLQTEAAEILEQIKADLTEVGQGVESEQAYGKYPAGAERQFEATARRNTRYRPAVAAVQNNKTVRNAAKQQRVQSEVGARNTRLYLEALVEKSIQF